MRSCAFSSRETDASETKYFLSSVNRTASSRGDSSGRSSARSMIWRRTLSGIRFQTRSGRERPVIQRLRAALTVSVIPAVERGAGDTEFVQGSLVRQMRLLDQLDDLGLLGCRISHASSSPSPLMLFLSKRFSRVRSATTSFKAVASRRRSFTSPDVAARAVSPANRRLPASRNSFDQRRGGDTFAAAKLRDVLLA